MFAVAECKILFFICFGHTWKQLKNCFLVFFFYTHSLVFYYEDEFAFFGVEGDVDDDFAEICVLYCICNNVNGNLLQAIGVPYHEFWQELVFVDLGDVVQERMVLDLLVAIKHIAQELLVLNDLDDLLTCTEVCFQNKL